MCIKLLWTTRCCVKYNMFLISFQSYKHSYQVNTIFIPNFQLRKLSFREVMTSDWIESCGGMERAEGTCYRGSVEVRVKIFDGKERTPRGSREWILGKQRRLLPWLGSRCDQRSSYCCGTKRTPSSCPRTPPSISPGSTESSPSLSLLLKYMLGTGQCREPGVSGAPLPPAVGIKAQQRIKGTEPQRVHHLGSPDKDTGWLSFLKLCAQSAPWVVHL